MLIKQNVNYYKMALVEVKELLDSGVHFGHLTRKWDPNMAPYIYMERNGIHSFSAQRHNIEDYAKDLIADNNGITQDKIMNCNNNNSAIKNKEVIDLCDGIIEVSNNNDLITTNHIILVVDSSSSMKTNDFTMKNSSGQEINISRWEAVCKYLETIAVDNATSYIVLRCTSICRLSRGSTYIICMHTKENPFA